MTEAPVNDGSTDDPADYLTGPILWGDSHVTLPTRTAERWAGPVPY
jgi:hypothetical protein